MVVLRVAAIAPVQGGWALDPLLVLLVTGLALVLRIFFRMWRPTAAGNTHEVAGVRPQLHHSPLRHLHVASSATI